MTVDQLELDEAPREAPTAAVAYLRVSTESQLDGFGLDIQRATVEQTAAEQGLGIVAWYVDEGICGAEDLDVRKGLASALDHLATGGATTLIIPRLDRLARDLMIQESVLADAWKAGATVLSGSETERTYCRPDNPDDPARTLIRQVLGAVAAYERAMIRLRMTRGRRRKLEQDGYAGGPQPYGWSDADERTLLDDVDSARRVGRTWRTIAGELNSARRFKRNGAPWTPTELQRTYARSIARRPELVR